MVNQLLRVILAGGSKARRARSGALPEGNQDHCEPERSQEREQVDTDREGVKAGEERYQRGEGGEYANGDEDCSDPHGSVQGGAVAVAR